MILKRIGKIQGASIDYGYIYNFLKTLMILDINNMGFCYRDEFERKTETLKRIVKPEIYYLIINQCTNSKNQIMYAPLHKIVDGYKYSPNHVRRKKNSSNQFSKLALEEWKKNDNVSKRVYEHYHLLGTRIEEKFIKVTKAFRFFDIEKVLFFIKSCY